MYSSLIATDLIIRQNARIQLGADGYTGELSGSKSGSYNFTSITLLDLAQLELSCINSEGSDYSAKIPHLIVVNLATGPESLLHSKYQVCQLPPLQSITF